MAKLVGATKACFQAAQASRSGRGVRSRAETSMGLPICLRGETSAVDSRPISRGGTGDRWTNSRSRSSWIPLIVTAVSLLVVACNGSTASPTTTSISSTSASTSTAPTTTTTPAPTTTTIPVEKQVEVAYLRAWDVYADAARRLDSSRLSEVFASSGSWARTDRLSFRYGLSTLGWPSQQSSRLEACGNRPVRADRTIERAEALAGLPLILDRWDA